MDKLSEIMNWKRREVASRSRPVSERELTQLGERMKARGSFLKALSNDQLSVIAEIKRKSPSAGIIAEEISAPEQARSYCNAGADALSILTDEKYFGGKLEDLWEVNDFLFQHQRNTPTLRKDFMVHPIQVLEALEAGARAILLIVRALNDEDLKNLRNCADTAGLDCLYEIHEEEELARTTGLGNYHDPRMASVADSESKQPL